MEVVLNKFFNGQSLFFQVHHPIHIKHELAHRSNQSQYLLLQLFDQKQLEHCVGLEVRKAGNWDWPLDLLFLQTFRLIKQFFQLLNKQAVFYHCLFLELPHFGKNRTFIDIWVLHLTEDVKSAVTHGLITHNVTPCFVAGVNPLRAKAISGLLPKHLGYRLLLFVLSNYTQRVWKSRLLSLCTFSLWFIWLGCHLDRTLSCCDASVLISGTALQAWRDSLFLSMQKLGGDSILKVADLSNAVEIFAFSSMHCKELLLRLTKLRERVIRHLVCLRFVLLPCNRLLWWDQSQLRVSSKWYIDRSRLIDLGWEEGLSAFLSSSASWHNDLLFGKVFLQNLSCSPALFSKHQNLLHGFLLPLSF